MRSASRPQLNDTVGWPSQRHGQDGAVLLEVILALVLFVGAAAVLTSGLSSSLDGVERLRLNTHAADMAVTTMSELQLGIKSAALSGPQPFEAPLESWTWEVVASPVQSESDEATAFKNIEVIIRHDQPPLVFRLSQVLQLDDSKGSNGDRLPGVGSF